ncbi:hypothetical protein [Burkholderia ubonensis]|uniref:hypothetical protein n=1 Tax=Burkholderia ubonensis TaxID=101571 RepID=UPI000AAFAE64|nr:hypothetical protein [Burkholderia ubonensis]
MPIDNPTNRGFQNTYTDSFIEKHIQGGDRAGATRHRMQQDQTAQGSTLLSIGGAAQLARDYNSYVATGSSTSITNREDSTHSFSYSNPVNLVNYNSSGKPSRAKSNNITFGTNQDGKIHHFSDQKSYSNKKNDGR